MSGKKNKQGDLNLFLVKKRNNQSPNQRNSKIKEEDTEIIEIYPITEKKINEIKKIFNRLIKKIGSYRAAPPALFPEGFKPIARSVSWVVEQMITQNLRKHKLDYNLSDVIDPGTNIAQYDFILKFNDEKKEYYINIKTSLTKTQDSGLFDIGSAKKLIKLYNRDILNFILLIVIIKISINKTTIEFNKSVVFNVSTIKKIYVNPSNNNLQTSIDSPVLRTNQEFINILKKEIEVADAKKAAALEKKRITALEKQKRK